MRITRRRRVLLLVLLSLAVVVALIPTRLFGDDYSFVLLDREGDLLGASLSASGFWRFPAAGPVSDKFAKALIAFEDKRFYRHPGIDLFAVGRAVRLNVAQRRTVSGASTITMQVARLGLGNRERNLFHKFLEAAVSLKLELRFSKADILRMFATNAPFGGNVVGLEAASWRYFGRSADNLSWAEAATLAVLPNSPALITLSRNRSALLAKRDFLLRKLRDTGVIDDTTLSLSLDESLPPAPYPIPSSAYHALEALKAESASTGGDFMVTSTIDGDWQRQANDIVADHLRTLAANGVRNAALVVIENATGEVRCYIGNSPDPTLAKGGYVDVVTRPRSTGSLLKPFLYAAMLDDGLLIPDQLVPDIPLQFAGFRPENAGKRFSGAVPAYMALARSLNIPAICMLSEYGIARFAALLKNLGMTTLFRPPDEYGLPLIIGGAEGTLWELAGMYSGLARNAIDADAPFYPPTLVAGARDAAGAPATGDRAASRGFSRGSAYLTLDALLRLQRPEVGDQWEAFASSRKIAWKTGTSQGNRDAWAIGTTYGYTVGVWVGNADGESVAELGGLAAAAPILFAAFDMLPSGMWFPRPDADLKKAVICAKSGFVAGPFCDSTRETDIPAAAGESAPCPYCVSVLLDGAGKFRTTPLLEGGKPVRSERWFVLPPAMERYYRASNADYRVLPPMRPELDEDGSVPVTLTYPPAGAQIYIPRDLDGLRGRLVAEAVHRRRNARVFWHLDETYLGVTSDTHQMSVSPPPGKHTLTVVDDAGETSSVTFTVLDRER